VPVVQTSPSSQEAPSLPGLNPHPTAGSHDGTWHADADPKQARDAPPLHAPLMQDCPMTHLSPDEQAAPSPTSDTTQPLPTTQATVWQGLAGWAHWTGTPPPQAPAVQVVPTVQTLLSSQGVPLATATMLQLPFVGSQAPILHGLAGTGPRQLTPMHALLPPPSGCPPASAPASNASAA